ncbi:MAG: flippase-like domain-containing protein [Saprospiraceae bacterium]|nr:flippase-like domain-containing protein [Saprospiraceae bacterium]MBK8668486.1 flippase-like domain-containing protein [Saprospiraceae bacterium]MBL0098817.1 flippase-like domain-containing protein [Saprospiraceae bacterium]
MRQHLAKGAKIGIFFTVGIVILYLVYRRQDIAFQADCAIKGIPSENCSLLNKIVEDISNANYYWVLITMLLFMATNIIRALRWKMMFKAIGYQPRFINLIGSIMINYLANLGIPRSGEIIRAGLISQYEDIPVEKVLGTIFTDRIFDVIMLLIVISLAMLLGGNDFLAYLDENINIGERIRQALQQPWLIVGFCLVTGILALVVWKSRRRIAGSTLGQKMINLIAGFGDGVKSVQHVSSIPLFIFYTLAIWFIYYLMMYFAFFTFTPTSHLGPTAGLVVFVFGSLGILIPTPGGMGSYHYLVGEALAMYGINGSDAFSFANIVFFSIQIFVNIFFGTIAILLLPAINKE